MYSTKDVITATDVEIMMFTQPLINTMMEYAKLFWGDALQFDRVYNE